MLFRSEDPSVFKEAEIACRAVMHFVTSFPICRPRAAVYEGWMEWLRGNRSAAIACWKRALKHAKKLDMPYDQAIALLLLAQHGKVPEAEGEASALLLRLGALPIGVGTRQP